jgi:hypothetical protein
MVLAALVGLVVAALAQPASASTAKKLAFTQSPPSTLTAGVAFQVVVQTQDRDGTPVPIDAPLTNIALSLVSSTGCPSSSHTLYVITKSVDSGDASKTNYTLKVKPAGLNCKLSATDTVDKLSAASSSPFDITGFACGSVTNANGGSCTDDPDGNGATSSNPVTEKATLSSCTTATDTSFISVDDAHQTFVGGTCDGTCDDVVLVAYDCAPGEGSTLLVVITIDYAKLPKPGHNKGASNIVWYLEGRTDAIPSCAMPGVLNPAPVCVSRQYSIAGGDRVTEILKSGPDAKFAH